MARGALLVLAVVFLLAGGTDALPSVDWQHGRATWSGGPHGKGNPDGACGYGGAGTQDVPLMHRGAGFGTDETDCGACFSVVCTGHPACSDRIMTVTVTDVCRDTRLCAGGVFEMSGTAFGEMAQEGRADELLQSLIVSVNYSWVDCFYSPVDPDEAMFPAFRVHPRASSSDFAVVVTFLEGMAVGDTVIVELKNKGDDYWRRMQRTHGATWNFTSQDGSKLLPVTAPLSIRVTVPFITTVPTRIVTALDVIPADWKAGQIYYNSNPTP